MAVQWQWRTYCSGNRFSKLYLYQPRNQTILIDDYRVFDPERDGKSKVDHVQDMLKNALYSKQLRFKTVLVDTWYASNKFMLYVHDLGKYFYCPIRRNRLVRHAGSSEYYQPVTELLLD